MGDFSPHCPECKKSDEIVILTKNNYYYVNSYYCKRCKKVFKANEGYPEFTESFYQVSGGSITWSGSPETFGSST